MRTCGKITGLGVPPGRHGASLDRDPRGRRFVLLATDLSGLIGSERGV